MPRIEDIVPGVAELRARERHNRALSFAGITRTVCGREVLQLSPRARLELQLLRNAFTVTIGSEPLAGDVFQLLWILSPTRGRGPMVDHVRQWLLRRHVKRLDLLKATREIRIFMVEQLQDLPESSVEGSDQSAWVHWMGAEASWWISVHGGFTFEEYLRTPYLVLQQLFRGWKINNPDVTFDSSGKMHIEEPQFINNSDRLIGRFHLEQRAAVTAILKQRRFRPA